ncbi:MAG TPA: hypothetical protein VFY45_26730, partial [Baekduia sp.]|nr:hypothetical protein [Baekduia sp.]
MQLRATDATGSARAQAPAGRRIQEDLDPTELDGDLRRGCAPVRRGKGGHRREVRMDDSGLRTLEPWLTAHQAMPVTAFAALA